MPIQHVYISLACRGPGQANVGYNPGIMIIIIVLCSIMLIHAVPLLALLVVDNCLYQHIIGHKPGLKGSGHSLQAKPKLEPKNLKVFR